MGDIQKMGGTGGDGTRRFDKGGLREAVGGVLPDGILWRQKEQFSDGVGYGWIEGLRGHAERQVGDEAFDAAATGLPVNPPQTKAPYWHHLLFETPIPANACAHTGPRGRSIAFAPPVPLSWDAAFRPAATPPRRSTA